MVTVLKMQSIPEQGGNRKISTLVGNTEAELVLGPSQEVGHLKKGQQMGLWGRWWDCQPSSQEVLLAAKSPASLLDDCNATWNFLEWFLSLTQ